MRIGLLWLVCAALLNATTFERMARDFPSWRYVLWEFDLPESFIRSPGFLRFASKHRSTLRRFYDRVKHDKPYMLRLIRSQLLQEDMSDLFVYMSIVESALRCDAVSTQKAAGVWQFIPATAKRYRLHCDSIRDERRDPVASTRAATEYLRHLHDRFKKWYLAVMAYNCGEGCLERALRKAGTHEAEVLLDARRGYLPRETREYLQKVVLLAMIAEESSVRVFTSSNVPESPHASKAAVKQTACSDRTLSVHKVRGGEDLATIATRYGTDTSTLFCLNPAIKSLQPGVLVIVPYTDR